MMATVILVIECCRNNNSSDYLLRYDDSEAFIRYACFPDSLVTP